MEYMVNTPDEFGTYKQIRYGIISTDSVPVKQVDIFKDPIRQYG